jgi:hypothetical protein
MSMKFIIKAISLLIIIFISGTAHAQRIKATASIDSTNILLGDQVKLFLEIDHPKNVKVIFPDVPDSIMKNIEVLKRFDQDTFENDNDNYQKQIQSFLITSFDSGSYRIPPFWFKIDLDNRIDSVPTNEVVLNVYSLPIDTTRGPTDIKMPYDAPLTLKEVTPYILGVILIAAILFFIFYAIGRRRKNKPVFVLPKKPKEPAHVIALRELNRIKKEKLWQHGKTKQFYSEVSETLRRYIEDRFDIPAMEQTSDETLESFRLQPVLLKNKTYQNLHMILSTADLVKFAKYQTLPDDDNMTLVNAYFFVDNTKIEKKPETPESKKEENGEEVEIK